MDYLEALGRYGANLAGGDPEKWDQYTVDIEMDSGYACCGGTDPQCYCSFAEAPSVQLEVTYKNQVVYRTSITYDFTTVVRSLIEIANG